MFILSAEVGYNGTMPESPAEKTEIKPVHLDNEEQRLHEGVAGSLTEATKEPTLPYHLKTGEQQTQSLEDAKKHAGFAIEDGAKAPSAVTPESYDDDHTLDFWKKLASKVNAGFHWRGTAKSNVFLNRKKDNTSNRGQFPVAQSQIKKAA